MTWYYDEIVYNDMLGAKAIVYSWKAMSKRDNIHTAETTLSIPFSNIYFVFIHENSIVDNKNFPSLFLQWGVVQGC